MRIHARGRGTSYALPADELPGLGVFRDGAASWFQRAEVIDMFHARHAFAVPLACDLVRSRRERVIERGIVPERTDSLVPGFDLLFARKLRRLERHPIGDWQDASAPALAEISADDLRQGSTVADEGWNRVDHGFRRNPAKGFLPHRRHDEYARQGEVV